MRSGVLAGMALIGATVCPLLVASSSATTISLPPGVNLTVGQSVGGNLAVAVGIDVAAIPGAVPFGATPANTPETVSFVLKEQRLPALEAEVEQGVRPYLSVSQFAQTYGQSPSTIAQLTGFLSSYGISSQVYPDDIDVVATGTAGEFDSALSVQQQQYYAPQRSAPKGFLPVPAQTFHGTSQLPQLPSSVAQSVLAVLGLTNYGPFASQSVRANPAVSPPVKGSTNPCLALTGLPNACNLSSNFAANYGLDPLYSKGASGEGQTLAIVTLAALDPGAPQYYWNNILGLPASSRTLTVDNIDGGSGAPSNANGTGETDLDVEQSGGVAPGANVIVYQAPNTDYGFADAFFTAASQNTASSVSTSWGESETALQSSIVSGEEAPAYETAFDEAFLEMAVQGQSGFDATGDEGAYDASGDIGSTNLSIDSSSDSPYITAAGATTLPWTGSVAGPDGTAPVTVPAQRAWGWDYLWQPVATVNGISLTDSAESQVVGSGGGYSTIEPTPSYQLGIPGVALNSAVPYLTPTDYQLTDGLVLPTSWSLNPKPPVVHGIGTGRAVPDLSTDGDPYSGYLLYSPSFAQAGDPELEGGWGGTSFVAPQLNGAAAVIDSFLGHRVGLWNPALYKFALLPGSTPFTPLDQSGTGNDNIYYSGTPGTLYNPATGLGVPNLAELAKDWSW
jgi:kumamolisin